MTNTWGTADQAFTRTIFDAPGRVANTADALGITIVFGYDAAGRRASVTSRSRVRPSRFAPALVRCGNEQKERDNRGANR